MSPVSVERVLRVLQGAENDLFIVFSGRGMWRTTLDVLRANPAIPRREVVAGWMTRMYVHYALMGIRRQLSNNPEDVSLRRMLQLVVDNPHLFTRGAFVARHGYTDPYDIKFANDRFEQWGPNGSAHLVPSVVQADIDSLLVMAERVENFATKTVAHLDREYAYPEGIVDIDKITWNDIDAVMDEMESVLQKYYPLVAGTGINSATPVPVLGWERAYTVPWKPEGQRRT